MTLLNFTKKNFAQQWEIFAQEVKQLAESDDENVEVFVFVFYTGHGSIYDDDANGHTWMIHPCGESSDIQGLVNNLADTNNVNLLCLLDTCRDFSESRGKDNIPEPLPIKGQKCILFAVKKGMKNSFRANEMSNFTRQFVELVEDNEETILPLKLLQWEGNEGGECLHDGVRNFPLINL